MVCLTVQNLASEIAVVKCWLSAGSGGAFLLIAFQAILRHQFLPSPDSGLYYKSWQFGKNWKWPSNPGAQKGDQVQTRITAGEVEVLCTVPSVAVMLEMQEGHEELQATCEYLTILSC